MSHTFLVYLRKFTLDSSASFFEYSQITRWSKYWSMRESLIGSWKHSYIENINFFRCVYILTRNSFSNLMNTDSFTKSIASTETFSVICYNFIRITINDSCFDQINNFTCKKTLFQHFHIRNAFKKSNLKKIILYTDWLGLKMATDKHRGNKIPRLLFSIHGRTTEMSRSLDVLSMYCHL